jgi:tetratricopeptide (TPR) repeat protein
LFAYDATLRVPLIFWSAAALRPGVVGGAARLVDVMPTILDLVGAPIPQAMDGRTLRPFIARERPFESEPAYFEALNANLTRNWAPLKGIVINGVKLIDLPIPELYDLAADPGEARNIYASAPDRARPLEQALDRLPTSAASIAPRAVDADVEQRLRSLGYVVGSQGKAPRAYAAADDPKRLVHVNNALDEAAAMWGRGNAPGAIETLQGVVKERPDLTIAYDRLAHMLRASGRLADAITVLDDAGRRGHADASLLRSLGSMLRDAGDLKRSASVLDALVRQDPSDLQSMDALGQTYARMNRFGEAEALFQIVTARSPNAATTWNNLGALYLAANRDADAMAALSRALTIDPSLAAAHNGLGVAHARRGEIELAVEEWREALRIRPDLKDARANLEKVGARP